jgi:hypothetical protein
MLLSPLPRVPDAHTRFTHLQAQHTAQAARSEAEQAVGSEAAALHQRCATAEAASAAAQSAAGALRAERGASTEPPVMASTRETLTTRSAPQTRPSLLPPLR